MYLQLSLIESKQCTGDQAKKSNNSTIAADVTICRGYARYFFTIFQTGANASAAVLYISGKLVKSPVDCDYSARATRKFFRKILYTQISAGRRPVNAQVD